MNSTTPVTIYQAVPDWFLVLATVLLVVILLMFAGLTVVMLQLYKAVQRLEPKVGKLMDQVNDELIPQVKGLVTRVDSIGSNIQGLTGSASNAMGLVRSKTESVGSAFEHLAETGMQKVEKLAPILGYLALGVRVYQMFVTVKSTRDAASAKQASKAGNKALPQATKK